MYNIVNILVTGGDGFTGSHFSDKLLENGKMLHCSIWNLLKILSIWIVKICESKSKIIVKLINDYHIENFVADLSKTKKLFKYEPKYTLGNDLKLFKKRLEENYL